MTPQVAALRIGHDLQSLENQIDLTLAQVGKLITTMAEARVETGTPLHTGNRAVARLTNTTSKLGEVRSDLVRIHADMLKVAEERGDMPTDCPNETIGELQTAA